MLRRLTVLLAGFGLFVAMLANGGAPAYAAKKPGKPKLTVGALGAVANGGWASTKITVKNPGKVDLKGLKVKLSVTAGAKVSLKGGQGKGSTQRKLKKLKPKRSTSLQLKVSPSPSQKTTVVTVQVLRGSKVLRKSTQSLQNTTAELAGRYFWHKAFTGYDTAVYFTDATYAYRGLPEGGFPTCTGVTAPTPEDDGCLTYTYDPATGAVAFGDDFGTYTAGSGLDLESGIYSEGVLLTTTGNRFDADLFSASQTGICPMFCTSWTGYMRLMPDGRFYRSGTSSWSGGTGGGVVLGPEEQGSYTVVSGSRIVFSYDDGTVSTESIALMFNDAGVPDAVEGGVILDGGGWFKND